jgi:uncharacterized damage-inducible protein DinB
MPDTNTDGIARFQTQWAFTRGLTMDLLRSLGQSDLDYSPGSHLGPLWKHFRHIGRVQQNYLHAMQTGHASFGVGSANYEGGASREQLLQYLERLDLELAEKLKNPASLKQTIDWFGETVELANHLARMTDHEVLHQGMFVVYMRLLGRTFPGSWSAWGL